jgi:transcription elongation GreA/GreB family factor
VRAALVAALRDRLAAVEQVAAMARDEASHAETKQEGKYDTRATEASYLARGQAERVTALRELVAWAEAIDPDAHCTHAHLGALLRLEGEARVLLLAPSGGPRLAVDGVDVAVISPQSPLGQQVLGREAGEPLDDDGRAQRAVEAVW